MRNWIILASAFFAVFVFPVPALISAASTFMVVFGVVVAGIAIYSAWYSGNKLYDKNVNEKGE